MSIKNVKKLTKKQKVNFAKIQEATKENSILTIEDALKVLTNLEQPKFKEGVSVELHMKLNINPTKSDQLIRSSVVLPHGTGKKIKIAAFVSPDKESEAKKSGADIVGGDDLIEEIKKSEKINFDIAIAEPAMMKKLPVIARLLGVAGVMPNPKTGTVGENISEIIELIKKGKVDFKNDKSANIHILCGKIGTNFTLEQLVENVKAAYEAVEKAKPEAVKKKYIISAHLACTMSPSIRIA